MSRVISIVLIIIVFSGGLMDLHDLAKLPYLIEHYNQHKSKASDAQFSLSEFFNLHYGALAEEHDKEEREQHKGLPFKAPDHSSIHSVSFLMERHTPVLSPEMTEVTYTNFYQPIASTEFHQSIFQPPRKG